MTALKKTEKVAKRGWSLDKFSDAVKAACKRAEVPAKKVSAKVIKDCYDGGATVSATVARLSA